MAQGYGSTEAGITFLNLQNNQAHGSVGVPLEGVEVMILDDNGKELKTNEIGNIYLRSNTMMQTYFDKSLNKDTLVEIKGKIWLNTGDMGYVDETNHVFFKERKKRLIKISGINVFPTEIEDVVNEIDEIKVSCASEGEIDKKPIVELYVQMKDGIEFNKEIENKIRGVIGKKLLKYSMPSKIIPLEKIPLNEIGKVDYKKIRC